MRTYLSLWLLASMLAAAGCAGAPMKAELVRQPRRGEVPGTPSGGEAGKEHAAGEAKPAGNTPEPEETPHLAAVEPRKVIYTGRFDILVGDVGRAIAETRKLAERLDGYMHRMTRSAIVVRVPAGKFDQAVGELEKLGSITERDVQAQDVTEQYVDLGIRLKSAKALLDKLLALLAKAKDVKEALAVEKEIARVRTEIERLEGQLNQLKSRVAYATITVNFRPMAEAPGELKVKLPFWWLRTLGLEDLTTFGRTRGLY